MGSAQRFFQRLRQAFHLLPALKLVWQASPRWTVAYGALIIVQGILPLGLLYLTKLTIDTVTANQVYSTSADLFQRLLVLLSLAAVVTLASVLCAALAEFVSTAQSQRVTDYMHDVLHAKSIEIDLEYYENSDYHDSLQRAQYQATYRPNQVLNNLVEVAQSSVSLIAMTGLLLSLHWGIAGILFVAAIPSVLVRVRFTHVRHQWYRRRTRLDRQSQYFSWLLIGDSFAKEIRLFNLGQLFSQRFRHLRQQLYKETLDITQRQAIANFVAQAIAAFFMFAAYTFIIYQAFQGILRIGDLVLYYEALQRGQAALKGLLGRVSALYEDNLFLANLYEFLNLEQKVVEPVSPKLLPRPIQSGIVFENVSFQYSHTPRKALKNINLILRPGEVIALVGANGSGKTTLVKLLCRLYDPVGGQITIDGTNLREFQITDLRRQISVIFQDYVKYHLTAHENIWLGNTDLPPTDDQVTKAACYSGADALIQTLPAGYDTILGKWFENGEELSIGQWQKIALARAFLRDSQVIVLDEPTSAMDPKAEHEIFQKFRQLIQHQAAILISHRLSTVKMADCIYVMDRGSIVESGSHDELIRRGGTYAELFETQAQHYR